MAHLDLLFRDYEIQIEAQRHRDYEMDAREQRQAELSRVTCADRLAAQLGKFLTVQGESDDIWRGKLEVLGLGWLQMATDGGEVIIPLDKVIYWEGGDHKAVGEANEVSRKLTLGAALRAISSAQREVQICHVGAKNRVTYGRVQAVGADYCEVVSPVVHTRDKKKESVVLRYVPFAAIAAIRVG